MAKGKGTSKVAKSVTFEAGVEELEEIIERIESGEIGLQESLSHYERGMALIQHCKAVLGECEQRVEDLTRELQTASEAEAEDEPEDADA